MAELVDALDLGSSFSRSEGSSPFVRIIDDFKLFGDMVLVTLSLASPTKIGEV
jgi:hypothetical protein